MSDKKDWHRFSYENCPVLTFSEKMLRYVHAVMGSGPVPFTLWCDCPAPQDLTTTTDNSRRNYDSA